MDFFFKSAEKIQDLIKSDKARLLDKKIPQKLTRSMQRNVTWQTSSEYRRLTLLSGRTLNYVSFVRKIQITEIFAPSPPSYVSTYITPV